MTYWFGVQMLRSTINIYKEICEYIHLTLNKEKCEFAVSEITYIGYKLTPQGIQPDLEKVKAITKMLAPGDKKVAEHQSIS